MVVAKRHSILGLEEILVRVCSERRLGVASALCYNHAETSTAALAVGSVMRAKTTRTKSSIAVGAICQL